MMISVILIYLQIQTVNVDMSKLKEVNFEDRIEIVSVIELSESENQFIAMPFRVKTYEQSIFIMDIQVNKLLQFSLRDGKFIQSIGGDGKGPAELDAIGDFDIDRQRKEIIVSDANLLKFLFFNLNGEFKSEFFYKKPFFFFAALKDSKKAFYNGFMDETHSANLHIVNQNFQIENHIFKFKDPEMITIWGLGGIASQNRGFFYNEPLSNDVYYFDENGNNKIKYVFDFKERNFRKQAMNNGPYYMKNAEKFNVISNQIHQNDRYLSAQINSPKENNPIIFYDKTKKYPFALLSKDLTNEGINKILAPLSVNEKGEFVSIIFFNKLFSGLKENSLGKKQAKLVNGLKKLTYKSNPIILIYKLK